MTLARTVVRGATSTLLGQWGRFVIQVGATAVLARLVTPEDYGLVGMVLAITGLATLFHELGLGAATVQRKSISADHLNTLFWINTGVGIVLAALFCAAAPLIAAFYDEPQLVRITWAMSLTFLLSGIGAQHAAILARRLEFTYLATTEIVAIGASAVVAIVAAWQGFGFWAIVIFHLVQPTVRMAMALLKSGWTPGKPAIADGTLSFVSFGAYLTGHRTLVYLARNMDNILIGRFIGASELGIYSKAYQLLLLPVREFQGPLHRVAVPTLSRLQDDPERFRRYYQTGLSATAFVAIPLIVTLAAASDEIVLLMLGPQWTEAAPIFRILAFAGLVTAVSHANGWLYISLGRTRQQALWGLVAHPIYIASFFVGLPWGIRGVALAFSASVGALAIPELYVATRGTPVSMSDIRSAVARPAVIGLAAYGAAVSAHEVSVGQPRLIVLTATVGASFLACTALVALWPAARNEFRSLVLLLQQGFGSTTPRTQDPRSLKESNR